MNNYHLVKVTNYEYAKGLQDGKVFMKTMSEFASFERRGSEMSNAFRGDTLEGVTAIFNKHNPHHFFEEAFGADVWEQVEFAGFLDTSKWQQKIYSLYCLEFDEQNGKYIKPDEQLKDFGDTAVIITDAVEFLRRVAYKLYDIYKDALWIAFKKVSYDIGVRGYGFYDEFSKSVSYSWQNEYRISVDLSQGKMSEEEWEQSTDFARLTSGGIATYPDPGNLLMDIGDIRNISILVGIEDFIDLNFLNMTERSKAVPQPQYIKPLETPRELRMTMYRLFVKPKDNTDVKSLIQEA